jgi:hypothetical protein
MVATFIAPSADPFERVAAALRAHGCRILSRRQGADSIRTTCPAHDDRKPSLVVTKWNGKVVVTCFSGCKKSEVLKVLGLTYGDLYYGPREKVTSRIEMVYPYVDTNGTIIAEKVRFFPKAFRWRVPAVDGKYTWDLRGIELPLYNLPKLIEARQVIVVEGEKSVERLRAAGLPATCGSSGASAWRPEWTQALWQAGCENVIVIADNDASGKHHALNVANACYGAIGAHQNDERGTGVPWASWSSPGPVEASVACLRVKAIHLPVRSGGDVVDWFNAGHTVTELQDIIAAAPYWSPTSEAEARLVRRREKTRDRMRKMRARDAANVQEQARTPRDAPNISDQKPWPPVTLRISDGAQTCDGRDAVTLTERTSLHITRTCIRSLS